MKKLAISLCLVYCSVLASAQKSPEFGLVLKSGIHTLPYRQVDNSSYPDGSQYANYTKQSAGYSNAVGVRGALPIGAHFKIGAEVQYHFASFSTETGAFWQPVHGKREQTSQQDQQINESSISIPISVQYTFRKHGKTAIGFGLGLSRRLSNEFSGYYRNLFEDNTGLASRSPLPTAQSNFSSFRSELSIMGGVYHRLNQHTTLGLEFTYERRPSEYIFISAGSPAASFIDCVCYGFIYEPAPSLRNLSVSLSHNLLR